MSKCHVSEEEITVEEAAVRYRREKGFFYAIGRLGLLRRTRGRPAAFYRTELAEFMSALTPGVLDQIRAHLKPLQAQKKSKTPALPAKSRPGRKPGTGRIFETLRVQGKSGPVGPGPDAFPPKEKAPAATRA